MADKILSRGFRGRRQPAQTPAMIVENFVDQEQLIFAGYMDHFDLYRSAARRANGELPVAGREALELDETVVIRAARCGLVVAMGAARG